MALKQFVVFSLLNEKYAIDIMKVDEIIRMMEITTIPKAEYFIEGIINLRGKVIPVIDLKKKFGLEPKEYDKYTRIMVVNIRDKKIGFIVDEVDEVMRIDEDDIDSTSTFTSNINDNFIIGVAKTEKGLIVIIDIEKVVSDEETAGLDIY
ncbi:purine-binding chemotaxis protein CheW [Deferribacter desulfuricans SSM1]|uniref:Chemotaxis protein CheW n=1 Tax=Deferribacter desulfuricans (strain DSM 14783 / JCM 11476 / NBRC 101012 / SSM1) TaxID=639282 RepID=D3PDK9_DEFDS|nr:chemotaxis protein CheW [Deferribacter desulfuricans]BAI80682.1 purine-binding chemotaxis protein CheW [Deferribacter desulfuricans SSM1]